jgi:hypothetical protein
MKRKQSGASERGAQNHLGDNAPLSSGFICVRGKRFVSLEVPIALDGKAELATD